MLVNLVSESSFTVGGHGVHSAFEDNFLALQGVAGVALRKNSFMRADVVHLHTVGPVAVILRKRAKRSVATAHVTSDSLAGSIAGFGVWSGVAAAYLRWFYNGCDVVVALSLHQAQNLRKLGVRSRILILGNTLPRKGMNFLPRDRARARLRIEDGRPMVVSVGQLQPRKAVDVFHAVAKELPDVQFVWVGGAPFGPLSAEYWATRRAVRDAPRNVRHVGQIPRALLAEYYSAADVLFHPSRQENFPVAVLEAAAARLPLVLRDLDVYREIFMKYYVPADDSSFAIRIRELFANPALLDKMSLRSQRLAATYEPAGAAAALTQMYRRVLESR